MNKTDKEYILCAAIHFQDGQKGYMHQPNNIESGFVVCGRRHHNVFTTVAMIGGPKYRPYDRVHGFLTSQDRFIDRFEAAKIALEAGQIKYEVKELYSENIY
jgi:hypothetical protein